MRLRYLFFGLPWLLALAALAWLGLQRFPPSGRVTFDVSFNGSSAWMNAFLPAERVSSPGRQSEGWTGQRILQDPVYSTARLPGVYDKVELEIEFRPLRQPLVEIGLLRDGEDASYDLKPLWYAPLENGSWRAVAGTSGTRIGFVRASGQDDELESSDFSGLAVWRASAGTPAASDPSGPVTRTDVSLRGSHDFWIIPSGNEVAMTFDLQDANRAAGGAATAVFRISRGTEEIASETVRLGGSRDRGMGAVVKKTVRLSPAIPGVYRVRLEASDDVFIRAIETASRHWVVGPRVFFGDVAGYATGERPGLPAERAGIAWSDSRHLTLQTFHTEGLQRVTFGSSAVNVSRTHTAFNLQRTDETSVLARLDAPRGDMRVIGDGWFAFAPGAFFAPQPRRVTDFMEPEIEGIQAILTPYKRPERLGDGWYRARADFSISDLRDRLRFVLSAPNLGFRAGAVDFRRVRLTYSRPPLSWPEWLRLVKREMGDAWRRARG